MKGCPSSQANTAAPSSNITSLHKRGMYKYNSYQNQETKNNTQNGLLSHKSEPRNPTEAKQQEKLYSYT
jgi:hypothetical protein